jgi:hypothetical protein
MIPPRRDFLRFLGAATSSVIGAALLAAQGKHKFPDPPPPAEQGDPNAPPLVDSQITQRVQLRQNEKEFRESLASLFERVSELKQNTEAMHTVEIFSVKVYKQTGEIEHLAKKLRNLAKS